jgi:hypothetical protein
MVILTLLSSMPPAAELRSILLFYAKISTLLECCLALVDLSIILEGLQFTVDCVGDLLTTSVNPESREPQPPRNETADFHSSSDLGMTQGFRVSPIWVRCSKA